MAVESTRPDLFPKCADCPVATARIEEESAATQILSFTRIPTRVSLKCLVVNPGLGFVDMSGTKKYDSIRNGNFVGTGSLDLGRRAVPCPEFERRELNEEKGFLIPPTS